jgi:hypothetical protein
VPRTRHRHQNIVVRDNLLVGQSQGRPGVRGFAANVGRVKNSQFLNNTVWHNDTSGSGFGELWIQYAEDNVVRNNVFVSTAQNLLVLSEGGNVNNQLDYNPFHAAAGPGAAQFVWNGVELRRLHRLSQRERAGCALAVRDPLLVDPTNDDFHLRADRRR